MNEQTKTIIVVPTKSMGMAIILAVILGPLGLFYSTILGGIVMLAVSLFALLIAFLTFGFGSVLFFFIYPTCIIWTAVATNAHNKEMLQNITKA